MNIKDLPQRIKQLALQRQQEQGNEIDIDRSLSDDKDVGGFTWGDTKEGHDFWSQIRRGDFSPFYELYGPDPELADMVMHGINQELEYELEYKDDPQIGPGIMDQITINYKGQSEDGSGTIYEFIVPKEKLTKSYRGDSGMFDTILIDFDGVLTNGKINLTHDGEAFREVHSRDLRAIREMIAKGIRVIIVTASDSPIIKQYAKKVKAELIVCREKGEINTSDFGIFGFVCDDVWDLKLAEKAAKVWTPADADQSLNKFEKLQTKGGDGVIAELVTILWQK